MGNEKPGAEILIAESSQQIEAAQPAESELIAADEIVLTSESGSSNQADNSNQNQESQPLKSKPIAVDPKKKASEPATLYEAEEYLLDRYAFRRNVVFEKTEMRPIEGKGFKPMTDRDYNSLYRQLQKAGIKMSKDNLRGLLNSDFVDQYNPFVSYIESLPAWDGSTDYIKQLADTVKTTDDPFWHECFRRWMVAMVGCATVDNIINHTVIVFAGKQGLGKTTWHLNLIPDELKDYRYSGTIKPGNKDSMLHLSETALINLDELESLNRGELGDLKEMITKSHIRVRRPYGYTNEKYIRRASFTGSVNKSQFLTDATGSRRFLCFEVTEIDYLHKVDLRMVYAQAAALLNSGFKYWFDDAEIAAITINNDQYQILTVEEELLLNFYGPGDNDSECTVYTTTELARILTNGAKISLSNSFINNLGKALHKHKFPRVKVNDRWAYKVKRLKE